MALRTLLHGIAFCALTASVAVAQNQTFINGIISNLNGLGLTNFTQIIKQIESDTDQIAFFLSLSDASTPKTLFAPNNDAFLNPSVNFYGYDYDDSDTDFLGALLLYHLVPGAWNEGDLGSGPNHTIMTSSLQGHGMSELEGDESQVIACGHSVAGFEIYNQLTTTAVISTSTYGHVTIHTLNAIIGIPGAYTFAASLVAMSSFQQLQQSANAAPIENAHGITIFAPVDTAFNDTKTQLSSLSPAALFDNHVIMDHTVWYNTFTSATYTSESGHNYSFSTTSDLQYTVTLNGVTANIIRSDFLIDNGVIHLIDTVLSNTAPPPTTTTSSSSASTSTSTTSSASQTSNTAGPAVAGASKSSGLSGGDIAGIVVGVVGGVAIIGVIALLLWRRQYQPQGYFDPPEPYTAVAPDTPSFKAGTPMPSIAAIAPPSFEATPYIPDVEAQVPSPAGPGEKVVYDPAVAAVPIAPAASSSNFSEAAAPQPLAPQAQVPISDEVVDHLLQRFAQRIDRSGMAPGDEEAPPMYPS
ncbi:hypothetical protein NM688_g7014 [Phlebia brevispora]|uniref:Uncharacterized protein n=1 Tax=Phlebia brevispora TaxID=194682 RepID=A0ACC1S9U7_9APHY|nr:hypothetical protein NM688_g7014 [Phlebia brevispora]